MDKHEFIETMGELAMEVNKTSKKHVLPSICVAQACLESGYGSSDTMMKYNAPFGIKYTPSWKGGKYSSRTGEYFDSSYVQIEAAFRAYDSLKEAVQDYYNLLTHSHYYVNVVNNNDVESAVNGLKAYATDPNYILKVLNVIKINNLQRFDKSPAPDFYGKVAVQADIEENGKRYVFDVNGTKNRLWFDRYDVLMRNERELTVLIGIGNEATCWVSVEKIVEV